ncbi:MAG TPA: hypothetical protein VN253_20135, partial [Kofleriaceae bacterium]|nr:hypothetical protein [Kofleriaceae bacterium]
MRLVASLLLAGLVTAPGAARGESPTPTIVQNDGFFSGQPVVFPSGLKAGDAVATRLVTPGFGGGAVIEVMVVFGGTASGTVPVTLKIWDDSAQTDEPGMELLSRPELLVSTAAPTLQRISLAGVEVPNRFRVGIVLGADALPTVGQDTDGTIAADNNFAFRPATGWHKSAADGVTGDWIIRANLARVVGGGGSGSGGG